MIQAMTVCPGHRSTMMKQVSDPGLKEKLTELPATINSHLVTKKAAATLDCCTFLKWGQFDCFTHILAPWCNRCRKKRSALSLLHRQPCKHTKRHSYWDSGLRAVSIKMRHYLWITLSCLCTCEGLTTWLYQCASFSKFSTHMWCEWLVLSTSGVNVFSCVRLDTLTYWDVDLSNNNHSVLRTLHATCPSCPFLPIAVCVCGGVPPCACVQQV